VNVPAAPGQRGREGQSFVKSSTWVDVVVLVDVDLDGDGDVYVIGRR
jgi:hypothetical protein